MRIYDGIFSWEGFGGVFQLAAGRCRLQIFDLKKKPDSNVALMKPMIVVVSDLPGKTTEGETMSVRSCAGHIATRITEAFHIDQQKMMYVEYCPESVYGNENQLIIPAKFDAVDFVWHDGNAMHPTWRSLEQPLQGIVAALISESDALATP